MPAVNWVERGLHGDGNSLPRYHIVWGTSRALTRAWSS
jgi:predicted oxidoreductase